MLRRSFVPGAGAGEPIASDFENELCEAVATGSLELVLQVLDRDAPTGQECPANDPVGRAALIRGCICNHLPIVALLLSRRCEVDCVDRKLKRTPLIWATILNNVEVVEYLVTEHKPDLEAEDAKLHRTALGWASVSNHHKVVDLLCNASSDVDTLDYYGYTPLLLACQRGHSEVAKLLLQHNADIEHQCYREKYAAIDLALLNNSYDTVKVLIDWKCNLQRTVLESTSFATAVEHGYLEVVQLVVSELSRLPQVAANVLGFAHKGFAEMLFQQGDLESAHYEFVSAADAFKAYQAKKIRQATFTKLVKEMRRRATECNGYEFQSSEDEEERLLRVARELRELRLESSLIIQRNVRRLLAKRFIISRMLSCMTVQVELNCIHDAENEHRNKMNERVEEALEIKECLFGCVHVIFDTRVIVGVYRTSDEKLLLFRAAEPSTGKVYNLYESKYCVNHLFKEHPVLSKLLLPENDLLLYEALIQGLILQKPQEAAADEEKHCDQSADDDAAVGEEKHDDSVDEEAGAAADEEKHCDQSADDDAAVGEEKHGDSVDEEAGAAVDEEKHCDQSADDDAAVGEEKHGDSVDEEAGAASSIEEEMKLVLVHEFFVLQASRLSKFVSKRLAD